MDGMFLVYYEYPLDIERNSRGHGSRVESILLGRIRRKFEKFKKFHRSLNGYRLVARPIYEAGIVVFIGQSVNSSLYYAGYVYTDNRTNLVPLNKIFLPAIGRSVCIYRLYFTGYKLPSNWPSLPRSLQPVVDSSNVSRENVSPFFLFFSILSRTIDAYQSHRFSPIDF